ncbi:hypothetical protein RR49_00345 [Microbacterium ginsengisoli]|uniref:Uncharacterized protein n=3 Tax=Microbacterium TaxID=33882 RepID=A0A0F0LZC1_9MICO|nr:hypothetical protein RR49_00345 [Microbacterium ginsengisoli]
MRRVRWLNALAAALTLSLAPLGFVLAASTGSGPAPMSIVLIVGVMATIVVLAVTFAAGFTWGILWPYKWLVEGYALRALLPTNPQLTVNELRAHLRRIEDFDRWSIDRALRPYDPDAPPCPQWQWTPQWRAHLLPGRAASWWLSAASLTMAAACAAVAVVASATIAVRATIVVLWLVPPALLLAAVVLAVVCSIKTRREYEAGYATVVRKVRARVFDVFTAVELIDARSLGIVRAAGALPLSTGFYVGRVRALRQRGDISGE